MYQYNNILSMGIFDKIKQLSDVAGQIKDTVSASGVLNSQRPVENNAGLSDTSVRVQELETLLKEAREENQKITKQLDKAQFRLEFIQSQRAELLSCEQKLEEENKTLQTEKQCALTDLEKCREDLEKCKAELAKANSIPRAEGFSLDDYIEREKYENECKKKDAFIKNYEKCIETYEKQVEKLRELIDVLNTQVEIRNDKLRYLKKNYFIDPEDLIDIEF